MGTPQANLPSTFMALSHDIPKLNNSNWQDFKDNMDMFFYAVGADYIADMDLEDTATQVVPSSSKALDKQLVLPIHLKVEPPLKHLVKNIKTSALLCWIALCKYFNKSTMQKRLTAHGELINVVHDTSQPIEVYIHTVTSLYKTLETLGYKTEELQVKDYLLLKLDKSWQTVRTAIMAANQEPTLETIKNSLITASSTMQLDDQVSTSAFSTQVRSRSKAPSTYQASTPVVPPSSLPPDDKGYKWCNTNNNGCYRCGRPNHSSIFCLINMPQYVKDWIMAGAYKEQPKDTTTANFAQEQDPEWEFPYESANSAYIPDWHIAPPMEPLSM
jgi:hypothetical protein